VSRGEPPRRQRGAALVELAVAAPLVLLLLFGTIEAAWAFAQAADVRHGVREGARLAAVDFGDAAAIAEEVCDRMDLTTDPARVGVRFSGFDPAASGARGDAARITVTQSYDSLTGFLDPLFQDRSISSTVEFRLEQPLSGTASWWNDTETYRCDRFG